MHDVDVLFEGMRENIRQAPVTLKEQYWERGVPVVGIYCVFTPIEPIVAAGAVPVSLCSTSGAPIAAAEEHLPRNLCPLIKASYGFAITDKCPYFHFSSLVVGETTCDGKKKMYEYLGRLKPVHVMQLPQRVDARAFPQWEREIRDLAELLEVRFGTAVTEDRLARAIRLKNRERKALNGLFALSRLDPPPLSGIETMVASDYARIRFDKEASIREIEHLTRALRENYEAGERRVPAGRRRVLVTGCPLGKAVEKVIRAVEENGAVVVAFENCGHFKGTAELVDEELPPFEALAAKYLRVPCSCISPNDLRFDLLRHLASEFRADGVLEIVLQACHTYAVETLRVREAARDEMGIPYLAVETDYSEGDAGQIATRVGAFVEMM